MTSDPIREVGMTDELTRAEQRGYSRGYSAGAGTLLYCERDILTMRAAREAAEAEVARLPKLFEQAIATVRGWYPEDVFLPDGESMDAKSARMARLTCDNVLNEFRTLLDAAQGGERE